MERHTCLNCGKVITWQFAICSDCEKEFGNKATEWPEWLRYLWNKTQRERRREKRISDNEISFTDIPPDSLIDPGQR